MAKYRMDEMNDLNGTGKKKLVPRMDIEGRIELKELCESINMANSLTVGDMMGAVSALTGEIARHIADGRSVKVDGLGTFTAQLGIRDDKKQEADQADHQLNAQSIVISGINFRPDVHFVKQVSNSFRPERSKRRMGRSSSQYTEEERLALAQQYVKSHPFLTVLAYAELTGLVRSTACIELRNFADNPANGIGITGRGSHRVYVANTAE